MKNFILLFLLVIMSFFCQAQKSSEAFAAYPLAIPEQNSLMAKWEKKPVLESKLIDDMEHDGKWTVTSIGQISYTQEHAKDGKRSLRFRTSIRDTAYLALPGNHGKWNSALEVRSFNANTNITSKQINLIAGKTEKNTTGANVTDQNKPYVAVISADKNPDLRKEVVGSYSDASILAKN